MPPEINTAPPPPSAHDAAMLAKVDSNTKAVEVAAGVREPEKFVEQASANKQSKPEGVPDKFWNAETGVVDVAALSKSYMELEKAKGTQEAPVEPTAPPEAQAIKTASEAVIKAGLTEDALATEFETTGDFSPASYSALEKAGFPNEMVKQYVSGVKAQAQLVQMETYSLVGGQDQYNTMAAWALQNMSQGEVSAFDRAVTGGNSDDRKQAITALKFRFESANGSEPTLLKGSNTTPTADAYQSRAEQTMAMRDPRYRTDPTYRATVERKSGNSTF